MNTRSKTAASTVALHDTAAERVREDDGALKELRLQLQRAAISFSPAADEAPADAPPTVEDPVSFQQTIVDLVNRVYTTLGNAQLEKTYQRALVLELRKLHGRGVRVLEELSIPILYDVECIGTRRADLVIGFADGSKCILELKAVASGLSVAYLKQLKYYMASFRVPHGILINFPRVPDFPDLDDDVNDGFVLERLQADRVLSNVNLRKRAANSTPELHYVYNALLEPESTRSEDDPLDHDKPKVVP